MKRITPILLLALACPASWAYAAPPPTAQQSPAATPPAIVSGPQPAAAWIAGTAHGYRVHVAWPPAAPAEQVGPDGRGNDDAPALASSADSGLMVLAVRRDGDRARLWSRVATADGWHTATWLAEGGGTPSAPALALRDGDGWAVWHAAGGDTDSRLMAAAWRQGAWSAPEPLPRVGGKPGLPAIALDHAGQPVVLWPESDGNDEEIWMARRGPGGWSRPRALSRNDVPDILPSIASDGRHLLAAWSRLEPEGHYAAVVASADGRSWERAQRVSPGPAGGASVAAAVPATVIWSEATDGSGARRLTGAEQVEGRWRSLGSLGIAINARHRAARDGGDLAIAWHQRDGVAVATARQDSGWRPTLWRGTPTARRPRSATPPDTFLGFGDSITTGLAQTNGVISFVTPYTEHLQKWTDGYLGKPAVVANEGLPGEFTAEGVERIRFALQGQRVALILEGANDMYNRFDPVTVAYNLRLMVQSAVAAGSIPVLSNVMPLTGLNFGDGRNLAIGELNELLRVVALDERAILVDMHAAFFGHPTLYSDDLHPNEFGYKEMAKVWFRGVKPLLDQFLEEQDVEYDRSRDGDLGRGRRVVRGGE